MMCWKYEIQSGDDIQDWGIVLTAKAEETATDRTAYWLHRRITLGQVRSPG